MPPVTALRSPPLSRMTGADSPVMADSSTEAMPSMTSPSPGMISPADDDHDVALAQLDARATCSTPPSTSTVGERLGLHLAQRVGLGLAAALGHGLGEVGEQHGEPEPAADQADEEADVCAAADERRRRTSIGRDDAADLDDEHDRVAGDVARVELDERRRPTARPDRARASRRSRRFGDGCACSVGSTGSPVTVWLSDIDRLPRRAGRRS